MDSFALPSLLVFEFLSFSLSLVSSGFLVALLHLSAAFLVVITVSETLRNVSEGICSVLRLSEPPSLLDHPRTRLLLLSTGTGSGSTLRSPSGTLAIILAFLGIVRDCVSSHEENSSPYRFVPYTDPKQLTPDHPDYDKITKESERDRRHLNAISRYFASHGGTPDVDKAKFTFMKGLHPDFEWRILRCFSIHKLFCANVAALALVLGITGILESSSMPTGLNFLFGYYSELILQLITCL
jgi:hypothetical protein